MHALEDSFFWYEHESLRIGCEMTASWCLQSLLSDPNPSSPANADAARLYSEDRSAYKLTLQCSIAKLRVDPRVDIVRKHLLCMQG